MKTNLARHRAALDAATRLVGMVEQRHLDESTPCSDWDLQALLSHMIGQNAGFAQAVRDGDAPVSAYAGPTERIADDLRRDWDRSADALLDAFADADPEAQVVLRELAEAPFPIEFVVEAQLLDTVVHTWDVASALGVAHRPDPEIVDHLLPLARMIGERSGSSSAFAAPVPHDDQDPWDELLALLGRAADWRHEQ